MMFDPSRRVFLGSVLGAAGVALATDHSELAGFDELMTSFVKEQRAPGAALAVTKDSRLVYARGFGLADRQRGQAVHPTDLFRIASISKPITAVAVLQMAERKKLALDAKVWDVLELPALYLRLQRPIMRDYVTVAGTRDGVTAAGGRSC